MGLTMPQTIEKKAKIKMPGIVQKIIPSPATPGPEKAEIAVEGADDLYKEIRIENALEDSQGSKVKLKQGDHVAVTVETQSIDTPAVKKG
jgi:hypothetical protein